jgi:predicted ATPase
MVAGTGRRDQALTLVDQAISSAKQNGTHFLMSEIVRIKADVLSQFKGRDPKEIEALLQSAIDVAAKQNASLPALRAATSLARFLTGQRRGSEARALLEPHSALIASLAGTAEGISATELT